MEGLAFTASEVERRKIAEFRETNMKRLVQGESTQTLGLQLLSLNLSSQEVEEPEEDGMLTKVYNTIAGIEKEPVVEDPPALKHNVYFMCYWATNLTTLKMSNMQLVNDSFCHPKEALFLINA